MNGAGSCMVRGALLSLADLYTRALQQPAVIGVIWVCTA